MTEVMPVVADEPAAPVVEGQAVLAHPGDGLGAVAERVEAEVPAAIKSKGTLTVASDATYAPNEFIGSDGKTVEGMDAAAISYPLFLEHLATLA